MNYDFETIINRKGQGSMKWDLMYATKKDVGDDIVPLSVADMEFENPPQIKEGLKKYIDEMILGYTEATDEYYKSVIDWMDRRHDFKVKKEWIVNTPGVVTAFFNAIKMFSKKGDGVVIMSPVYYPFYLAIEKNDRKVVDCPLIEEDNYYRIDFEKFDDLTKENKLFIFCSPHNPIGRVWTKEELKKLEEIIIKNNVIVISDEIHHDLIMPGYKHTVLQTLSDELADRTITCTAASKTFNIAGLSMSNIIIKNEKLREEFQRGLDMASIRISMMGIKGTEIAYNECEDWLEELLKVIDKNQKLVSEFFAKNYPMIKAPRIEGTYLQWIDFRALNLSTKELENLMQQKAEVFLDEGYIFGELGNGFERINLAAPTVIIEKALERIGNVLAEIV